MLYNIHLFGNSGICPECSGLMVNTHDTKRLILLCKDCRSGYAAVKGGITDKEILFEKMGGEKNEGG